MAIGCQWVYAAKTNPDGKFDMARAQVIAQEFTQRPGMDYFKVTAPIVKLDSLQLVLAMGNSLDWEIEMMDVKSTFSNSDLNEEIYMQQPEGFNDGTGQVLRLHRDLNKQDGLRTNVYVIYYSILDTFKARQMNVSLSRSTDLI